MEDLSPERLTEELMRAMETEDAPVNLYVQCDDANAITELRRATENLYRVITGSDIQIDVMEKRGDVLHISLSKQAKNND